MKIAQVVCAFPPYHSGIGRVAHFFARELSNLSYDVTVFTPRYGNESELSSEKYKIKRLKPILKLGNGAWVPQLIWDLKNYDIVHLHYPFFGGTEGVWLANNIHKFKLYIHYHMEADLKSLLIKALSLPSAMIKKSIFKQAAGISCASLDYVMNTDNSKFLYNDYGNKLVEIPFGVETDKFYPKLSPANSNIILFVGGLDKAHNFKGLNLLLKAVGKISDLDWSLVIVGEGELKEQYRKQAQDLGIGSRVRFLGGLGQDELIKAYQDARMLVLPSINEAEAFGLVLLEAMACGIPVLASKLPGVREVFKDNNEGCQVTVGDVDDLSTKIKTLLKNDSLVDNFGKNGRLLVKEKYSWQVVGENLNNLYKSK